MYRKLIREGIRSLKNGKRSPEHHAALNPKGVVPTYGQDTVIRVPRAPTAEADKDLLRKVGRRVAQSALGKGGIDAPA
jgi:hypothetical protein